MKIIRTWSLASATSIIWCVGGPTALNLPYHYYNTLVGCWMPCIPKGFNDWQMVLLRKMTGSSKIKRCFFEADGLCDPLELSMLASSATPAWVIHILSAVASFPLCDVSLISLEWPHMCNITAGTRTVQVRRMTLTGKTTEIHVAVLMDKILHHLGLWSPVQSWQNKLIHLIPTSTYWYQLMQDLVHQQHGFDSYQHCSYPSLPPTHASTPH